MASLATIDDLEVRLGRTVDNEDQAQAALDDASAAVRAYTGQTFDLVEDDEVRIRARNGRIVLPQRPVTAVSSILNIEGGSVDFIWDSGSFVSLTGFDALRSFEVEPFRAGRDVWVDVTYSHGFDSVPADIVAVVAQVAGRALGRTPDATAMGQESIAGYSYSVGNAAVSGALGFTLPERQVLNRYRVPLGTIRVSA